VDPRVGLDGQKISSPPGFDPGPSSPYSVAIPTELSGLIIYIYICYNINISPCVAYYAMKTYGGMEVHLHNFFNSALDGGGWSDSESALLCQGNDPHVTVR